MNKLTAFFALFLVSLTIFTFLFIDVNLIFLHNLYSGISNHYRILVTAIYIVIIIIFFVFYLIFLKKNLLHKNLTKLILISFICLVFSYPAMLSYDIFNYMATAKVTYFYHENPYIVMPIEFIGDPMLLYTRAANKVALYGPSWIIISALPSMLGFQNFIAQLYLFKLTVGFFYLATCYVLYKLTKNTQAVLFFALNPLVLIESLVSSHNDVVMMFLSLAAFYFLKKKRFFFAILLLVASIFVKFSTLLLLPVFIFVLWSYVSRKSINWNKVWLFSAACMFFVFLLAPIREETYSWYAIWFIPFVGMLNGFRNIKALTIVLSLGLLLSYVPYMYLGDYLFPSIPLKYAFIIIPVIFYALYIAVRGYEKSK